MINVGKQIPMLVTTVSRLALEIKIDTAYQKFNETILSLFERNIKSHIKLHDILADWSGSTVVANAKQVVFGDVQF